MNDETTCQYVSSRGLMKSCDVYSPAPTSSCDDCVDYIHPETLRPYSSIYVCNDSLAAFVRKILPRICTPFILVSGDSDKTVPHETPGDEYFATLIDNPYLIHWFCQNCVVVKEPKITLMPIGLDYHTLALNTTLGWRDSSIGISSQQQEKDLQSIQRAAPPLSERVPRVYSTVHFTLDRFGQRAEAVKVIPDRILYRQPKQLPRNQTWKAYTQYAFVLSPTGNGIDCHRTWEALLLGCIPIVLDTEMHRTLFKNLPVLMVKSWGEITPELLWSTIERITSEKKTYDVERLKLGYWVEKINSYRT